MPTSQCAVGQLPTPVTIGGTAATSFTAYAPVCGGTSSTGAWQSASTGIGSTGYVLTSTGSSSLPSFQANPTSSMVLLHTATASNSASIIFNNTYITNTYSNYYLYFSNVQPVTSLANLCLQVSINNGVGWISTNYQSCFDNIAYTASTLNNTNSTTLAYLSDAILGTATSTGYALFQNVTNGAAFQMQGNSVFIYTGPTTYFNIFFASNTATNVNAIKIYCSTGNINTGTFSLYGIVQ